ncbi:hypothetical protein B0A55_05124 [Friedmanniomyces simplex]|uniref:Acyl-coenzyme A oxidase n=1 Tax=Friedmanniomyces simplex TaxID=329884 RepID=A0A4U0X6E6_9PEZI|nr:hypothetical protein B0A55_05124 [Friedmanniomyces simplex]
MALPNDFTAQLKPHPNADGARILADERLRSEIDIKSLSLRLFGTKYLERQQRILSIILQHRVFSKANQANLSRPDRYKLGLARGKRMRQLMDEHSWDDDDLLMAEYLVDDIQPYHLHMSLFTSAMREQCSDEQRREWMPKIAAWEVIGAYAQTELGHGSNVRGIELSATWDGASKSFILHIQIRVLPLLATAFALHYSGAAMRELYERTRSTNALDGDRAQLAELHSTSAGLKSLATELAANGIETCRRAMGGHGYSGGTGLVQLNADYLSKPTVEGDNWMITQQVARSLIKKVGEAIAAPDRTAASSTDACLMVFQKDQRKTTAASILRDDAAIVAAFENRMAWMAFRAHRLREVEKRSWNSLLIDFHKLSRAYSQCILVTSFYKALDADEVPAGPTRAVLFDLFRLFAFTTMDADSREFQQSGAVAATDLDALQERILELMGRIRPHAVRLVDAFALPDYLLDSALGRYDGKVYEQLFYNAHVLNPLNRTTFNPDYRSDEIVMGSGDGGAILAKL